MLRDLFSFTYTICSLWQEYRQDSWLGSKKQNDKKEDLLKPITADNVKKQIIFALPLAKFAQMHDNITLLSL